MFSTLFCAECYFSYSFGVAIKEAKWQEKKLADCFIHTGISHLDLEKLTSYFLHQDNNAFKCKYKTLFFLQKQ